MLDCMNFSVILMPLHGPFKERAIRTRVASSYIVLPQMTHNPERWKVNFWHFLIRRARSVVLTDVPPTELDLRVRYMRSSVQPRHYLPLSPDAFRSGAQEGIHFWFGRRPDAGVVAGIFAART